MTDESKVLIPLYSTTMIFKAQKGSTCTACFAPVPGLVGASPSMVSGHVLMTVCGNCGHLMRVNFVEERVCLVDLSESDKDYLRSRHPKRDFLKDVQEKVVRRLIG